LDPHRKLYGLSVDGELHAVGVEVALAALHLHPQLIGRRLAHDGDIVPHDLGNGIRKLLHPRVVRKAARQELRVRPKDDFELLRVGRRRLDRRHRGRPDGGHVVARVLQVPVVQHATPPFLERPGKTRTPLLPHEVVPACVDTRRGEVEHLDGRVRVVVQRLDQGLDDRERAVVGAPVAPLLQVVRTGEVPPGCLGRLIAEASQVH